MLSRKRQERKMMMKTAKTLGIAGSPNVPTGPAYVKGSTKPTGIFIDRVIIAR